MNIDKLIVFGMFLQGDIFVDGIGTTKEDDKLLIDCMKKFFNLGKDINDITEEQSMKIEKEMDDKAKQLVIEYRKELMEYLK